MDWTQASQLGLAIGLGLLVGFQREWASTRLAGIRTFPLVTLLGTLTAWLARDFGGWVLAAGLVALALTIGFGTRTSPPEERADPGITTEAAVLVMFAVGALVALGQLMACVVVTGAVAVLLHWERPLHDFVRRVGEEDLRSVMRLVLIGLVILPALPNRSFGPFAVLNPFEIWSMVVLIVGISLCAYVAQRFLGMNTGTLAAGVLGGLISSTATTVSYARRSRSSPQDVPATALVLAVSSTVVLPRVLVLVTLVAPGQVVHLAPPLVAMLVVMGLVCVVVYLRTRGALGRAHLDHAPSDLRAAVAFGALYSAVLLGIAAARQWLGAGGLYAVATLSGLTDVDAITLSTARMLEAGRVDVGIGWRLILVGVMANLAFKAAAALGLGHPALRSWIAGIFGSALVVGAALLWRWPGA